MDLKLKNKISLVCAASEGLGKAAALELAKEGSTIAISSRNKEKLELAKNEISSETGSEVKIYEADLTSEDQIINLYKQVQTDLGEVEILVNNIGGPLKHLSNEWLIKEINNQSEINFKIDFEIKNIVYNMIMTKSFDKGLRNIANAFEQRAIKLFNQT